MFGFGGFPYYLPTYDEESKKELLRCWNLMGDPEPNSNDSLQEEKNVFGVVGCLGAY